MTELPHPKELGLKAGTVAYAVVDALAFTNAHKQPVFIGSLTNEVNIRRRIYGRKPVLQDTVRRNLGGSSVGAFKLRAKLGAAGWQVLQDGRNANTTVTMPFYTGPLGLGKVAVIRKEQP